MAKYRPVYTKIWSDPWFVELSNEGKLLYLYLFTNDHINEAGIYPISEKTMKFETSVENVNFYLKHFEESGKIRYLYGILWVKNFMKYQPESPQRLKRVAKDLEMLNSPLIKDYLNFNDTVTIPYQYRNDKKTYNPNPNPNPNPIKESGAFSEKKENPKKPSKKILEKQNQLALKVKEAFPGFNPYSFIQGRIEENVTHEDITYTLQEILKHKDIAGDKIWRYAKTIIEDLDKRRKVKNREQTHEEWKIKDAEDTRRFLQHGIKPMVLEKEEK